MSNDLQLISDLTAKLVQRDAFITASLGGNTLGINLNTLTAENGKAAFESGLTQLEDYVYVSKQRDEALALLAAYREVLEYAAAAESWGLVILRAKEVLSVTGPKALRQHTAALEVVNRANEYFHGFGNADVIEALAEYHALKETP